MQSRDLNQDLIRLTRERLIDLHKMGLLSQLAHDLPKDVLKSLKQALENRGE